MTQAERDAEIRRMRDRLREVEENRAAVLGALRRHQIALKTTAELLDYLARDASMQKIVQEIPDGLPSSNEIRELLADLRASIQIAIECRNWLTAAGY